MGSQEGDTLQPRRRRHHAYAARGRAPDEAARSRAGGRPRREAQCRGGDRTHGRCVGRRNAVVFLASDRRGYITATHSSSTGGLTAARPDDHISSPSRSPRRPTATIRRRRRRQCGEERHVWLRQMIELEGDASRVHVHTAIVSAPFHPALKSRRPCGPPSLGRAPTVSTACGSVVLLTRFGVLPPERGQSERRQALLHRPRRR